MGGPGGSGSRGRNGSGFRTLGDAPWGVVRPHDAGSDAQDACRGVGTGFFGCETWTGEVRSELGSKAGREREHGEEAMRLVLELLLAGLAGFVGLKVVGALVLPLFGMLFGLVALLVKLLIFGVIAYLVYTLFRRWRSKGAWA